MCICLCVCVPQTAARDSLICAHVPSAITVFNRHRQPVHQNPASLRMFGVRTTTGAVLQTPGSAGNDALLGDMFALQPEKLDAMWQDVMMEGSPGCWKGGERQGTSFEALGAVTRDCSPA